MKFSTGLLDSLFGEKITIDWPQSDGRVRKITVTKKWFDKMKREGHITPSSKSFVKVHMLGVMNDYSEEHWVLGEDIDKETYGKFRDEHTGDIYAMTVLEDGKPVRYFIKKARWDELRRTLDKI